LALAIRLLIFEVWQAFIFISLSANRLATIAISILQLLSLRKRTS
jgi:hypothetical protein